MTDFVQLPEPQKELAFPLMKAIEKRRTKRKWKEDSLSLQDISNILWVACGKTMEETKKSKSRRTVPSGRNSQTIKVYAAMDTGLFLYDENLHGLVLIKTDDVRENLTNQKMMKNMPFGLVYVSDFSRLKGYVGTDDNRKLFVAGTETGFISQNVYLYCASAGLNTAVIGLVNREKLHETMGLADYEKIVYTQAIGKALDD
ncbi:SagB/ThcOx family dehydrogenase [Saccharicrinis aurantiacus]|uniref:SagB/ThcOx family dehydrogenase n=1 Tax=Saccharicrinis aurantiacus TaxID=1849719 RepID=UPI00094F77C0|nr:SagB/ThcOx family dehydrogenase [Saccharicrinis aurantiacus]